MRRRIREALRAAALSVPPLRSLAAERDRIARQLRKRTRELRALERRLDGTRRELKASRREVAALTRSAGESPAGHFYSPLPDLAEVRAREGRIWAVAATLPGIDACPEEQLDLLETFGTYYRDQPFGDEPGGGLRYGFANQFFSYGDGLALYCMLRHLRPARIVEVGSGWSSALMLDVVDRFLDGTVRTTFIEPYPDRLNALLTPADAGRAEVLAVPLHEVETAVFTGLDPGDVLFIDSTHVSKIGSDVNRLVHEILPILPAGVHVHVHDIFWPFEYPPDWVYRGRAWNEAYLLRAYLTHNPRARITWFNHYLATFYAQEVAAIMPLWRKNSGGSLWFITC